MEWGPLCDPCFITLTLRKRAKMIQPMYNGSAQISKLPDDKQLIIDAGISLFVLEKRSRAKFDSNDYGYANCKAIRYENSNNLEPQLIWFSGKRGYVRYTRDENRRYIGYCPDDPEWYNRILLSSSIQSGKFVITKYIHAKSALITSGQEITEEIYYIGTLMHDWVAKIDGEVVIRSKSEKEVMDYVKKKRFNGTEIQGPVWALIEELEILREGHRHDWMFSPEFQNKIIPDWKNKISLKFKSPELEAAITKMVPEILNNMSLKQLTAIVKKKRDEMYQGEYIENGELFSDGVALKDLPMNKIRTIALKEFKIKTKGISRDELIRMINEKIKEPSDDVNDLVGPPTPEEIKNRELAGLPPLETIESI